MREVRHLFVKMPRSAATALQLTSNWLCYQHPASESRICNTLSCTVLQLQAALGITGVEGGFRQGCEHVLRVARQHSTTLSSLLQAILTDPLVAWAPDKQQAGSKKVGQLLDQLSCPCVEQHR